MTHHWVALIAQYSSVVGFMIGLPVMVAAYYEPFKAPQEARLTKAVAQVTSLNPALTA